MGTHRIKPPYRLLLGPLCCCTILSGCVSNSTAPAPKTVPTTPTLSVPAHGNGTRNAAADLAALKNMPGALLDPSQGTEDRNVGKRIRWAGAVQYIDASGKGDCLTILYARSGDHGEPRWTSEPTYQTFRACAAGSYDPELVATFSNVTIVGRISGKANIGMGGGGSTGPVVEIEKLFRWSDCVAGDTSAICKYGFISPTPASR